MAAFKVNQEVLVRLTNANLIYDNNIILENINYTIYKDSITTLIGPNGGGKTSLAKIILKIIKPTSGDCYVKKSIKIGYMPQKILINPQLPISVDYWLKINQSINKQITNQVIDLIDISKLLNKQLTKLSGGELQRVMLARTLLNEPQFLILDEPLQGVDITGQTEFYELINLIKRKKDITIMMISHDLHMVMRSTEKVICLNKHICCQGSPADISNNPLYLELFGKQAMAAMAVYTHHHDHIHDNQ